MPLLIIKNLTMMLSIVLLNLISESAFSAGFASICYLAIGLICLSVFSYFLRISKVEYESFSENEFLSQIIIELEN